MNNIKVSPSILSGDFANMSISTELINLSGADMVHIDVMDGVYVPNITFGMPMVSAIKRYAKVPLDVHLMIVNPEKYVMSFIESGADIVTFHPTVCDDVISTLSKIRDNGAKCGLVINPNEPIDIVLPYLDKLDIVMFMGVYPGFSNQKFIPEVKDKIGQLKNIIDERELKVELEFDGGVSNSNASDLVNLGITILVSGSSFFNSSNPVELVNSLKGIFMIGAIVLNGELYSGSIEGDYIVSTDGGYDKCASRCDLIVGDMDSVQRTIDIESLQFEKDKDLTDGEIAVNVMIAKGVEKVNIYGLNGGRLDHILANIGLMAQLVRAGIQAVCYCNDFTGYMVNKQLSIKVLEKSIVSLAPYTDKVHIISLEGVKWGLSDYIVDKASSLCMSNVAISSRINIEVEGEVLVIVNK